MSLFTGGDGANIKDSIQICLVKIVQALTKPGNGSAAELPSYPATGVANVFVASAVARAAPCVVYKVTAFNTNASTRYLQIFDATSLPANGTTPLAVKDLATKTSGSIDFGSLGLILKNGLTIALSTTDASLTVTGTADGLINATYV